MQLEVSPICVICRSKFQLLYYCCAKFM